MPFMSDRRGKTHWLLCLAGASVLAGVALVLWLHRGNAPPSPEKDPFPLPPFSTSPYLNTGKDVRYVGSAVCAECHPKNYQSYLLTAHSRALSDLDPKAEPPDGSFFHKASGRSYRVYRRDGQFRHEEVLRTADGEEIARMDLPIRCLIGSGHFTRTYLVEVEGFLYESPITWYTSRKQWDMSPGYDSRQHWGFERAVTLNCLLCHSGRAEPAGNSVHRMTFHEKAIGCENCHGPGSQHEALHRANKHPPDTEDLTIVHPAKLSRARLEAICAVCHLNGPAKVYLRGRRATDFRPGMPLTDYRIDYRFDRGIDQMTVVGHIGQLQQSACYQKSSELTCLTCHDPHARQKPKDSIAFYRQKCLSCHAEEACKLDPAQRQKRAAGDNCAACHMPRGGTDIPHIAFTHHRIGRHTGPRPPEFDTVPNLVPTEDVSHLSSLDQKRNLGLAYLDALRNPIYGRYAGVFGERVREHLEAVRAEGLREGDLAEGLAQVCWNQDLQLSAGYARLALQANDLSSEGRAMALIVRAHSEARERKFQSAIELLGELVRMRRFAEDWRLLGKCYLDQGQPAQALASLQQALAIRPYRYTVHADLAETYRRLGDLVRAGEHEKKARWLLENNQY
jgi:hypothetical protein